MILAKVEEIVKYFREEIIKPSEGRVTHWCVVENLKLLNISLRM